MTAESILVVDDEPDICTLVSDILTDEGYAVTAAETAASAREYVSQGKPDLVLLDIWMPDEDGITLLKDWKDKKELHCPVVMMSGHGTVETAVEATRLGAFGFIEKPLTTAKLISTIRKALDSHANIKIDGPITDYQQVFVQPIGTSPLMRKLIEDCKKCAQVNSGLVAIGEEGSGRSTMLRYVHQLSGRSDKPFTTFYCDRFDAQAKDDDAWSKVKAELIESIKLAEGGALFFQGIDQIKSETQQRLLDLLRQLFVAQVFKRFDVRVNASVHKSVAAELLNTFQTSFGMARLHIPSLRNHSEDIPELVNHFIDYFCASDNYPYRKCSIAAQNALLHYAWPLNIAELKGLIQDLLVLGGAEEIDVEEVKQALITQQRGFSDAENSIDTLFNLPLREAREAFEKQYLLRQLKKAEGSVSKLADLVGMERTHLYRKLRALGIGSKETN